VNLNRAIAIWMVIVIHQLKIGALWVVLIVIFEFSLGTALGYTRERMLSDYNLAQGGLMGFGLAFMLLAPALGAKLYSMSVL